MAFLITSSIVEKPSISWNEKTWIKIRLDRKVRHVLTCSEAWYRCFSTFTSCLTNQLPLLRSIEHRRENQSAVSISASVFEGLILVHELDRIWARFCRSSPQWFIWASNERDPYPRLWFTNEEKWQSFSTDFEWLADADVISSHERITRISNDVVEDDHFFELKLKLGLLLFRQGLLVDFFQENICVHVVLHEQLKWSDLKGPSFRKISNSEMNSP